MNKRFNLLPHRQMRRRWALRVLARQIGVTTALGIGFSGLITVFLELQNDYEEGYNKTLNAITIQQHSPYKQATALIAQRDSLIKKKEILERVDARRTTSVLIMNDIARNRPDGVYLTRMNENGDSFNIEGRALTSEAVAKMFERMASSENIDGLVLEEVQWVDQNINAYAFLMKGRVRLVGSEKLNAGTD